MIEFLAAPFVAGVVFVFVLGYFGLHVLRREIIFVDLALAQIAALGTVIGLILGHEAGSTGASTYALATTTLGAAILSLTRTRTARIPQEALIGVTYVVATAATIIVADLAPEGAEHVKELLAGSLLWVTWPTVAESLLVCLLIGGLHLLFRSRFILVTEDPEGAAAAGMRLRRWDFFFYLSFGVVIVLAVEVAGVLMVFSYLVAPAIVAIAISDSWPKRLLVAWSVGIVATAAGLLASYHWDLPSGPAIVCVLGAVLVLFALARAARRG